MRKLSSGIWVVLTALLLAGCASSGEWANSVSPATDCPGSASSYHEREGMAPVRPGDCRPTMKVPIRGNGQR